MTPTLKEAKDFIRVEVDYLDEEITMILLASIGNAENVTGRNYTDATKEDFEVMPSLIKQAVLMDVATGFSNRNNNTVDNQKEAVNASIFVYRQHSKRPMF